MTVLLCVLGLAAAVGVFLPHPAAPVGALAVAVGLTLAVEPGALRRAWRIRTLTVVMLAAFFTALAVAAVAGPTRGAVVGGAVLLRFLTLVLLATTIARRLDTDAFMAATARSGIRPLGLVIGLALNTLPHLVATLRDAWTALAVRCGSGRVPLRRLPLLAEAILAHTGHLADDAAVAAALRGHAALGLRPSYVSAGRSLVVVTGPPGSGKTLAVSAATSALADEGLAVAGFVQEAIREEGATTGFFIRDLHTGDRRPLAALAAGGAGEHGTRFYFHKEGFALARQALSRARHAALLVADELGPVELRGGGHMPALRRALRRSAGAVLLCTVRRHLVPSLLAEVRATEVTMVDVAVHPDPAAAIVAAVRSALGRPERRPATPAGDFHRA